MLLKNNAAWFGAGLLLVISGGVGQSCVAADQKTSCQTFVQHFYNWYNAKGNAGQSASDPLDIALKTRGDVFSPELRKRLKEDIDASAKSPGEIVGLDFDPILNAQIDVPRCKAEKVTNKGKSFLVEVYLYPNGKKDPKPNVQPELIQSNGKWQFVNFHYNVDNKPDDLLHVLKELRDERKTFKK